MISKSNVRLCSVQQCVCCYFLQKKMYMYKTTLITRLSFCDIRNNQGFGKQALVNDHPS